MHKRPNGSEQYRNATVWHTAPVSLLLSLVSLLCMWSVSLTKSPCPHSFNPVCPALTSRCFPGIRRDYWVCFLPNAGRPCPESQAGSVWQSHRSLCVNSNVPSVTPSPEPQHLHDFVWKPRGCWMSLTSAFPNTFHMLLARQSPVTPVGQCALLAQCIIVTRCWMM